MVFELRSVQILCPQQWEQHKVTDRKEVREPSVWFPDTSFNKEHCPLCVPGFYCSFYATGSSDVRDASKKGKRHRDIHTMTQ